MKVSGTAKFAYDAAVLPAQPVEVNLHALHAAAPPAMQEKRDNVWEVF